MYSCTYNVRYSETDQSGHLSTAGMLDFFQDCAVAHSAAAGLSIELLARRGFAWVLNSWQADISRMPKLGEQVKSKEYGQIYERSLCIWNNAFCCSQYVCTRESP